MFICHEIYSSVINLDLFWKHLFSHISLTLVKEGLQKNISFISFICVLFNFHAHLPYSISPSFLLVTVTLHIQVTFVFFFSRKQSPNKGRDIMSVNYLTSRI